MLNISNRGRLCTIELLPCFIYSRLFEMFILMLSQSLIKLVLTYSQVLIKNYDLWNVISHLNKHQFNGILWIWLIFSSSFFLFSFVLFIQKINFECSSNWIAPALKSKWMWLLDIACSAQASSALLLALELDPTIQKLLLN